MKSNRPKRRIVAFLTAVTLLALGMAAPAAQAAHRPPAPTDLEVTRVHWDHVELAWQPGTPDNPPYNWHYEITEINTRETWISHSWVPIRPVQDLAPATTYTFEVRLVDTDRRVASAPSNRVTVRTLERPHVEPPSDLEVTDAYSFTAYFSWDPSPQPGVRYRLRNVDGNLAGILTSATSATTTINGRDAGQTYTYDVVAVKDGVESAPSNQVTVTTPPVEAPTDVAAERDGNDVTLTWSRPASVDPARGARYFVYDNGALERVATAHEHEENGVLEVPISRAESGETHDYTVQVQHGVQVAFGVTNTSGQSGPASVTVPASDDTTPPTPPAAVTEVDGDTGTTTFRITEQSTDDTSPQSEIRYEGVARRVSDGELVFYAHDYDLPLEFDDASSFVAFPQRIRAVDEAGNRSEIVSVDFVIIDN